jgi:hypothetical protein
MIQNCLHVDKFIMKKSVLKTATIMLLILAGSLVSCGKEKETILIPCNLQTERIADIDIQNEEVLFLKKPPANPYQFSHYIYEIEGIYILHIHPVNSILFIFEICNFPQYAKEWIIPNDGFSVVISGKVYGASNSPRFAPFDRAFYDLELISLEKKKQ